MKTLLTSRTIKIPDGVTVEIKSKQVRVKGPRGVLTRDLSYFNLDMYVKEDGKTIQIDGWFALRKEIASIRTCASHIENLITGVTRGFRYKMRLVYAHFPINATITDNGDKVELRNFLGEKRVRRIAMQAGVKIVRSDDVKDELVLTGNDVELVSRTCAHIHQSVLVRNKDIRKFLDGIYVSEKGAIPVEN
eukprot:jgi/Mesvir1/28016/Mv20203-RA.1